MYTGQRSVVMTNEALIEGWAGKGWFLAASSLLCGAMQASVCSPTIPEEAVSAAIGRVARTDGSAAVRTLSVEESSLRVRLWRSAGGNETETAQAVRFVHDYRAHDIDARVNVPTNGHMHRTGLEWRLSSPQWEVGIAPVLAASSNAGRHPHVLDASLVDWQGSVRRIHSLSPNLALLFGGCRDDRHGERRIEPSAAIRWRGDTAEILLGYPDSKLQLHVNSALQATLSVSPAGGVWHAFDKELTRKTRFARRGWRLEAELGWSATPHHQLLIATGLEQRRSLQFEPEPETSVRSTIANAPYISLRWRWLR